MSRREAQRMQILEEAATNNFFCTDVLDQILSQSIASKKENYIAIRTSLTKFACVKTLESFNFQPSIAKKRIKGPVG